MEWVFGDAQALEKNGTEMIPRHLLYGQGAYAGVAVHEGGFRGRAYRARL